MTSRLNWRGPLEWPGGYEPPAAERSSSRARSELATPSRWLGYVNGSRAEFTPCLQDGYLGLRGERAWVSGHWEGEAAYDRAFEG